MRLGGVERWGGWGRSVRERCSFFAQHASATCAKALSNLFLDPRLIAAAPGELRLSSPPRPALARELRALRFPRPTAGTIWHRGFRAPMGFRKRSPGQDVAPSTFGLRVYFSRTGEREREGE